MAGALGLGVLAVVVGGAPLLAPADPLAIDPIRRLAPPSRAHPFGTDHLGRDLASRIIHGSRYSVAIGLTAILLGAVPGCVLGLAAGYPVGPLGLLFAGTIDVFLVFPMELVALAAVGMTGTGLENVILAISVGVWPRLARVVRGEVLRVRENDYVAAARALGSAPVRLLGRHVFPNILAPIVVSLTFYVGAAILIEAALSFLGLGVPPPTPTWGNIANDSRAHIVSSAWGMLFSGAAIGLTVLSLNLVGDGLRDHFDPRLR
jgi:peptide/nickel transport system permease protein